MGELVGSVLQAGHGGGGQGVGVLRQRVQHLAVDVASHQVAEQLDLTGVVWEEEEGGGRVRPRGLWGLVERRAEETRDCGD